MLNHFVCKVYSLATSSLSDVEFPKAATSLDIIKCIQQRDELKQIAQPIAGSFMEPSLVLLPSTSWPGKVFKADDLPIIFACTNGFDISTMPFSLFHQPALVRVSPADSKRDTRQILLDLSAPLVNQLSIFQNAFEIISTEFSFRLVSSQKDIWIHSQLSLAESGFDAKNSFLELVSNKTITSRWKELVMLEGKPDRVGFLFKQTNCSSKRPVKKRRATETVVSNTAIAPEREEKFKSLRKSAKRWFVMKDIFLAYFKNRDDNVPSSVIALDYHIVRLSDELKKGERLITLERSINFAAKSLEQLCLASDIDNENEIRLWYQSMNGRCANAGLNRIFGMPILHQLCHSQHGFIRNPALGPDVPLFSFPPFFSQCIAHLMEHGLDCEGIFRISPPMPEILSLKELFDTGVPIDLSSASPHLVATLLKLWLRELPEPLVPYELYPAFLSAVLDTNDRELKCERIMMLLEKVPEINLRIISEVGNLVHHISLRGHINRMSCSTLAILLGPSLLRDSESPSAPPSPNSSIKAVNLANEAAELMLENPGRVEQIAAKLAAKRTYSRDQDQSTTWNHAKSGTTSPKVWSQPPSRGAITPTAPRMALDLSAIIGGTRLAPRKASTGVIRSLDDELPPLKEDQVCNFNGPAQVPTVVVAETPASSLNLRRNIPYGSGWKSAKGSVSPLLNPQSDFSEDTSSDDGRRGSIEQSHFGDTPTSPGDVSMLSPRGFMASLSGSAIPHSSHNLDMTDYRTKLAIKTLQETNFQLSSKVADLEQRLAKEIAERKAMENKLMGIIDGLSSDKRATRDRSPRSYDTRDSFSM